MRLATENPQAWVVVTGGAVDGPVEGRVMAEWLASHGVEPERLVVEDKARFTRQNAAFVLPLLAERAVRQVVLVSDAYHLPRCMRLFGLMWRRKGLSPVRVRCVAAVDSPGRAKRLRRCVGEWLKLRLDLVAVVWPGRRRRGRD